MGSRHLGYIVALLVFAADQLSKWIVAGPLDLQAVRHIDVLPIFDLAWTENKGISLGLFSADSEIGRWILVAVTAAIASALAIWIGREKQRGRPDCARHGLGGALGNISTECACYVVDFADLHFRSWPEQLCWSLLPMMLPPVLVFNVADQRLAGVVMLTARLPVAE